MLFTVLGASGHTGRRIAQSLLRAGERVRAVGRSEARLEALKHAGAELCIGDVDDRAFLPTAFRGADAIYALLPADPQAADFRAAQDRMGEAIAAAVRDSGVRRVVALSSLGAELSSGNGPIAGLHAQEQRLGSIAGLQLLLLRPAWFFENVESQLEQSGAEGVLAGSIEPEVSMPMVGTADIAAAAVAGLRSQAVGVQELLGPHDLDHRRVARELGAAFGRTGARYVRVPDDAMARQLVDTGVSPSFADLFVEMTRAINAQRLQPLGGRTDANTTPTSFAAYAADGADAAQLQHAA